MGDLNVSGGIGGAASGAAIGGPVGAAIGGIFGLFGGDDKNETTASYEELGPERQGMLDPSKHQAFIDSLESKYGKALTDNIKQSFNVQRGQMQASFKRTGTGPASVINSQRGELAQQESVAVNKGLVDASTMANTIGNQQYSMFSNTAGNMMNTGVNIFNSRRQTGGSSTAVGSELQGNMALTMDALTNKDSYLGSRVNPKSGDAIDDDRPIWAT